MAGSPVTEHGGRQWPGWVAALLVLVAAWAVRAGRRPRGPPAVRRDRFSRMSRTATSEQSNERVRRRRTGGCHRRGGGVRRAFLAVAGGPAAEQGPPGQGSGCPAGTFGSRVRTGCGTGSRSRADPFHASHRRPATTWGKRLPRWTLVLPPAGATGPVRVTNGDRRKATRRFIQLRGAGRPTQPGGRTFGAYSADANEPWRKKLPTLRIGTGHLPRQPMVGAGPLYVLATRAPANGAPFGLDPQSWLLLNRRCLAGQSFIWRSLRIRNQHRSRTIRTATNGAEADRPGYEGNVEGSYPNRGHRPGPPPAPATGQPGPAT